MKTRVWRAKETTGGRKLQAQAIDKRNELVSKLTELGICPKRPHEMKMRELERMLENEN